MDELIKVIIGVSGTFLGAILGYLVRVYIEHRLAIDRIKENIKITEFNKACSKIKAAFAPTISFIYIAKNHGTHDKPNIDEHIKNCLLGHGAAVEEFRPFVSSGKMSDYQKAWEDYRKSAAIDQYTLAAEAKINGISEEEYLEKGIHNILQYAEFM